MKPRVSVFCLTYNHGKYISRALDSILGQETSFAFEVMIHDDCSNDGTLEIIRQYEERYDNVHVLAENVNQYASGRSYTTGILLPASCGDYIAFCEGDDYWTDNSKLQKQYDYMESHKNCSLVCASGEMIMSSTGETIDVIPSGLPEKDLAFGEILDCWPVPTASFFLRREVLEDYASEWTFRKPLGDLPMALFSKTKGAVHYFDSVCVAYRFRNPGSWTDRMTDASFACRHYERMVEMFESIDVATGGRYADELTKVIENCLSGISEKKGISALREDRYKKYFSMRILILHFKRAIQSKLNYVLKWFGYEARKRRGKFLPVRIVKVRKAPGQKQG